MTDLNTTGSCKGHCYYKKVDQHRHLNLAFKLLELSKSLRFSVTRCKASVMRPRNRSVMPPGNHKLLGKNAKLALLTCWFLLLLSRQTISCTFEVSVLLREQLASVGRHVSAFHAEYRQAQNLLVTASSFRIILPQQPLANQSGNKLFPQSPVVSSGLPNGLQACLREDQLTLQVNVQRLSQNLQQLQFYIVMTD